MAFLSLSLALVSICGIVLAVAYQLGPWRAARVMASIDPGLNETTSKLPDTRIANLGGDRVEYFGFSFVLPWKHIEQVRSLRNDVVFSSSNGSILFTNPLSDRSTAPMIHKLAKSIPGFGTEERRSLCDVQQKAIQAKADQVKWWKTPGQNERAMDLLLLKEVMVPKHQGAHYAINSGGLCGFQVGDPVVAPYAVWIELFDSADRHYQIAINSHGERPAINQAEINAIVASIHPASGH